MAWVWAALASMPMTAAVSSFFMFLNGYKNLTDAKVLLSRPHSNNLKH
jgi:hypothetical protein